MLFHQRNQIHTSFLPEEYQNKISDYNFPKENCVFKDKRAGILLYKVDCIKFMDTLIEKYLGGLFAMIFADPPYFLSNGGITCHSGKMVKVDKGDWDKSNGADENHKFNLEWLSRCQKLLKKTVLYGFLELITLYILLGLLCNN